MLLPMQLFSAIYVPTEILRGAMPPTCLVGVAHTEIVRLEYRLTIRLLIVMFENAGHQLLGWLKSTIHVIRHSGKSMIRRGRNSSAAWALTANLCNGIHLCLGSQVGYSLIEPPPWMTKWITVE
jgi:hypothetical protein